MGQRSGFAMSCGVDCRHGSDLVLLWLWCRSAAVASIRPLAWELPYAVDMGYDPKKKRKEKKKPESVKKKKDLNFDFSKGFGLF